MHRHWARTKAQYARSVAIMGYSTSQILSAFENRIKINYLLQLIVTWARIVSADAQAAIRSLQARRDYRTIYHAVRYKTFGLQMPISMMSCAQRETRHPPRHGITVLFGSHFIARTISQLNKHGFFSHIIPILQSTLMWNILVLFILDTEPCPTQGCLRPGARALV